MGVVGQDVIFQPRENFTLQGALDAQVLNKYEFNGRGNCGRV